MISNADSSPRQQGAVTTREYVENAIKSVSGVQSVGVEVVKVVRIRTVVNSREDQHAVHEKEAELIGLFGGELEFDCRVVVAEGGCL